MEDAAYAGNCVSCGTKQAGMKRRGKGEIRPYRTSGHYESLAPAPRSYRREQATESALLRRIQPGQDIQEQIFRYRRELDDSEREDIAVHWRTNRGYRRERFHDLIRDLALITPYRGGGNPTVHMGSLAAFYDNSPRKVLYFKIYRGRVANALLFQDLNTYRIYKLSPDETTLVDVQGQVRGAPKRKRQEIAVARLGDPHFRPARRGRETMYFHELQSVHGLGSAAMFDLLNEESVPSQTRLAAKR